ncbi:malectin domain-containing carbohydrate-binding protein [Kineococcus indalonis]|uniref:malectin domain-containing carbohydrate-binding protein n=1 Tax=Kineococcus indalonis TaxID=2696566 RepID=UPI001412A8CB|nr:malectin domain-containing carbohydrate-binding protein [Kineococcus indalonis]NAZ85086.1 hypothetical protein [Kineococcus indalonis]
MPRSTTTAPAARGAGRAAARRGRRRRPALALLTTAALAGAGLVTGPAAQAAAYDLVVTDVRPVLAGTQATGSQVLFQATVHNRGNAPTPAGVVHGVAFTVDGRVVSWDDTSTRSLPAGASRTLTASGGPAGRSTWTAGDGRFTLGAWVDDVDRLRSEADEGDNRRSTELRATPVKPVTQLSAAPALTQAQFEQTHARTVRLSWRVPDGQPAGVRYRVLEHPTDPDATCSPDVPLDKGVTTGAALTFDVENGLNCSPHVEVRDVQHTVVAEAPAGGPAVTSAASGGCRWVHDVDSSYPQQAWDLGCAGSPQLHDFTDPVQGLVDAGSAAPQGRWEEDHGFTGGTAHTSAFPGLAPELQTSRWGWTRYSVPVDPARGDGTWTVRLTFVEPTFTAPGRRVFDVRVDGRLVADDLDVFARVGRGRPYVLETTVPATGDTVEIVPTRRVDNPIVAAVEVLR